MNPYRLNAKPKSINIKRCNHQDGTALAILVLVIFGYILFTQFSSVSTRPNQTSVIIIE